LSNKNWVLAAQVPGLTRVKAKQTIEPTAEALLAALQGYRERAKGAGCQRSRKRIHFRSWKLTRRMRVAS